MNSDPLLKIEDLKLEVKFEDYTAQALNGISLHINQGESLGIVGESGCGKSLTALAIMQLLEGNLCIKSGSITFENRNMLTLKRKAIRKMRGNDISMIFQEPMTSLNPVFTIGHQIVEAITLHRDISKKQAYELSVAALEEVGIPSPVNRLKQYPHNMSGGMRQRVMIAMALACQPKLLIADEPTTALDVTIQAQILRIIDRLRKKHNMAVMFITHDLGVIAAVCERVVVMYAGQMVESAPVKDIFKAPHHPYTRGLIASIPLVEGSIPEKLPTIEGRVPSLQDMPDGCRFNPRCESAMEICTREKPPAFFILPEHSVFCWLYNKKSSELPNES
ncbi:MAG: ABC transporter ATP-binding protein [Proteobacteria bacterium]|nr:ABC transporter ATP-binding protein [Pseudomonadota bacterium]MBU1696881.1 ABC transporter ATP-binding protein [Pseudomonadota bacterium]